MADIKKTVYIIPGDSKPVKVVYENDACDSKIEVDDLTGEVFVERPLSPSERESLLKLIKDGTIAMPSFGVYTFETDGTTLSIKGD